MNKLLLTLMALSLIVNASLAGGIEAPPALAYHNAGYRAGWRTVTDHHGHYYHYNINN